MWVCTKNYFICRILPHAFFAHSCHFHALVNIAERGISGGDIEVEVEVEAEEDHVAKRALAEHWGEL